MCAYAQRQCAFPIHSKSETAGDNKKYEWGVVRHNKRAGGSATGVKECEMVREKEGAGINKSIVHGCGMKGRLLPVCD